LRLALLLLAAGFGWYTWLAFGLTRAGLCYEHGGFPNPEGFCEPPAVQVELKIAPPSSSALPGPVL
jgi:hypothetical protein